MGECVKCNGTGEVSCEACGGTGFDQDYKEDKTFCIYCGGKGTVHCNWCDGTGTDDD